MLSARTHTHTPETEQDMLSTLCRDSDHVSFRVLGFLWGLQAVFLRKPSRRCEHLLPEVSAW